MRSASWKDKINSAGIINTAIDNYLEGLDFTKETMKPDIEDARSVESWDKDALVLTIYNYESSDNKVKVFISSLELVYQKENQYDDLIGSKVYRLDEYFDKHRSKITIDDIDRLLDEVLN